LQSWGWNPVPSSILGKCSAPSHGKVSLNLTYRIWFPSWCLNPGRWRMGISIYWLLSVCFLANSYISPRSQVLRIIFLFFYPCATNEEAEVW
jgi:hypothetical protein